jgi:hypothetical protein
MWKKRFPPPLEFFSVLLVTLAFTVANSFHVVTQWLANPDNRVFTGIAHYAEDYFLYISTYAQGAWGSWFWNAQRFTNEPMAATWIYWQNVLFGHIGSWFGLSPFASYNIALMLFVVILSLLWYTLSSKLFISFTARVTSFLFIISASSFYDVGAFIKTGAIHTLGQFWFSPTPAFNRLGGVPHQVFQTILFVLLSLVFTKAVRQNSIHDSRLTTHDDKNVIQLFFSKIENRKSILILLIALTILASTANPIIMLEFVGAAFITTAILLVKDKKITVGRVAPIGIIAGFSLPSALILNAAFKLPILSAAQIWENSQHVVVSFSQFFLSVGPITLFVPFGFFSVSKKLTKAFRSNAQMQQRDNVVTWLFFLTFGLLSLITFFSPIPSLTHTVSVRWLHPAPYALLPLLAAEGVLWITRLLTRASSFVIREKSKDEVLNSKIENRKSRIGLFFLVFLYTLLTLPVLYAQIDARANPVNNAILMSDLNHVPKPVVEALQWLKNQPDTHPVTLMDPSYPYDILVPVFSDKITFTGHPIHTLYDGVKESLRIAFFNKTMSTPQAQQFFRDHRIGYIITKPTTTLRNTYAFIKEIFRNDMFIIYSSGIYDR